MSETLVADLDTPVSAYLKLANGEKYSCLLESVEGGDTRGRYSIIGLRPDIIWRSNGDKVEICRTAVETPDAFVSTDEKPLESLRSLLGESLIDLPHPLPPMAAGIVGYMGYDMVRQMEDIGPGKPDPLGVNTSIFIRPTVMAIFDSVTNLITLVTPVRPHAGISATDAYSRAEQLIEAMLTRLDAPLPLTHKEAAPIAFEEPVSNTSRARYYQMIAKAQDYILAGDIFQVVLSQRFSMPFGLPPFALYRALRRTNPSPFMYHLAFEDLAIVGSSPEILVRLRDSEVTIRPIAGTRKRGASPEEDADLAADLLADEKELAEHLMLLDLGRNDVGRVSKPGTVQVTAQNTIEYYSHVMHIVSNVVGEIKDGADAIDALSAGFPAGTVSGAPKVRAMEIIDELEVDARGPYAGSVGYFSANGSMDSAIVLRTAIVKDGMMHVQAGAGIVADSKPEGEYQECENKARALVSAAQEALRFARSNRG
nr:anthranilate synthase component I [Kordiimonas marina]